MMKFAIAVFVILMGGVAAFNLARNKYPRVSVDRYTRVDDVLGLALCIIVAAFLIYLVRVLP